MIPSTGRVEQRVVELPDGTGEIDDDRLVDLRPRIARTASGQRIAEAATALSALLGEVPGPDLARPPPSSRRSPRRCPTTAARSASWSAAPPT